jgi:acetoin utilization protein AcuB
MTHRERLSIAVEEFATPSPVSAPPTASFAELKKAMSSGGFRHLPILNKGEVVGVVSDRDLRILEGLGELSKQVSAADFMARDVLMVSPKDPLESVVLQMSERKVGSAVVCDQADEFLGIFTSTDAMNALVEIIRGEVP